MGALYLDRINKIENNVYGVMVVYENSFCYTLENYSKMIPAGIYKLGIHNSPKFKRELPHILDVPNRTHILIHEEISIEDTEGCILAGMLLSKTGISDCKGIPKDIVRLIKTEKIDKMVIVESFKEG